MRTFVERTREDCERVTRRAARAYTKGEISEEQMTQIIRGLAGLEDILEDVEENGPK